jgi:hypothetical protein
MNKKRVQGIKNSQFRFLNSYNCLIFKLNKSALKVMPVFIALLFLLSLGCSQNSSYEHIQKSAKNPFAKGKLQLGNLSVDEKSTHQNASHKIDSLPSQFPLHFILNNNCIDEHHETDFIKENFNLQEKISELETQSYSLILKKEMPIEELSDLLENDPCIIGAAKDEVAKIATFNFNDPYFNQQSFMQNLSLKNSHQFLMDPKRGATASVAVGVIDSGIDYNHEDLINRITKRSDGSINGYENFPLDPDSKTFPDGNPMDDLGHGTFVAGIIGAATNNQKGVSGIFSNDQIKLMPIKVTDEHGATYFSSVAKGIDYARNQHVDVINMSLSSSSPGLNAAIEYSLQAAVDEGIFISFAAGNNGAEVSDKNSFIPCVYGSKNPGAICVGATSVTTSKKSSFSNYGPNFVEISAPGSHGIFSTTRNSNYKTDQGTSFASPIIAAAAALTISTFKSYHESYKPSDIKYLLMMTSEKDPILQNYFKNGSSVNFENLSYYLKNKYFTKHQGGFTDEL